MAQDRLRALYDELGKHKELGKPLGMLIDGADSPEARARLRIDSAMLQLEKFEAPRDASDTLRAVLDEDPDHEGASRALATIHEKTERFGWSSRSSGRSSSNAHEPGGMPPSSSIA